MNRSPANQQVLWDSYDVQDVSWSGNLGLLYHVTPKTDITFNAARAFRSPFLEERYQYIDQGNLVKIGDPNLKPEEGRFFDVGLRHWGERFRLNSHVFYNQINNMVVEVPTTYEGRNAFMKTNIGSVELYGADLHFEFNLNSTLSVYSTAAYTYGQDTYAEEALPLVPPLNGRLGVRFTHSLFSLDLISTLFAEQDRTASWELTTPGYTLFDAYVTSRSFALGQIQAMVFLGVENILDRDYRNHLSTNRGSIMVEPGRNVSIRFQLNR